MMDEVYHNQEAHHKKKRQQEEKNGDTHFGMKHDDTNKGLANRIRSSYNQKEQRIPTIFD
jgi:hypothetical protein